MKASAVVPSGKVDEARIYDRALGAGEILETMNAGFPTATTETTTEVGANDAVLNGTADANGGETEYFFEYGPTKAYGSVVTGEELGSLQEEDEIAESIIDLAPETTYHYRLVANSPAGTAHGKDRALTTAERTMTLGEEEELTKAENSFSLTSSASKAGPGDFYGMMWTGNLSKMLDQNIFEAVERSGAKMLRLEIHPGDQTQIDKAFSEAAKDGITILPYFGSGAFPKPGSDKRKNWIDYAKKMVKEYGPDSAFSHPAKVWEIWNEPNMSFGAQNPAEEEGKVNPKAFASFFKEMSDALRNTSEAGIQILAPGMYGFRAGGCHPSCHLIPRAFMNRMDQALKDLGASNAYDAVSLHPYVFKVGRSHHQHAPEGAADVKRASETIMRIIAGFHHAELGKPLWITELGFPVANPGNKGKVPTVSYATQKMLVQASFSKMQNNRNRFNLAHAFYYNIQDDANPGWEYHSGLLTQKGKARPWASYSDLADGKSCPHAPC